MKLLVTGGAGFIGSNFVLYMIKNYPSYEIINVDALTYAGNLENLRSIEQHPNYTFVKADIANSSELEPLFEQASMRLLTLQPNRMWTEAYCIRKFSFRRIFLARKRCLICLSNITLLSSFKYLQMRYMARSASGAVY